MTAMAVLALLAPLVATGCALDVDTPDVSASTRSACAALVRALPARAGDQSRRDVGDDAQSAAWGDPAIELRCGVGPAAGFTRSATCQSTDGLDWFVPEDQLGTRPVMITMTTIYTSPRIEVRVPAAYWPPTAVMVDLAAAVKAHTRRTGSCV